MWLVVCALVSYLVGTINPSYLIAKKKNFDIRKAGSGNAGGSNALITMGKKVGVFCMLFDILKAYVVVRLAMIYLPDIDYAGAVASTAVILGHIFPVWMKLKGGKGLACLGGAVLAYSHSIALILLVIEFVLALIIDYICVVPFTVSVVFPAIYYVRGGSIIGTAILLLATVAIYYKHVENIKRIRAGEEAHFSFLWKAEAEKLRIKNNVGEEEYNMKLVKSEKKVESEQ